MSIAEAPVDQDAAVEAALRAGEAADHLTDLQEREAKLRGQILLNQEEWKTAGLKMALCVDNDAFLREQHSATLRLLLDAGVGNALELPTGETTTHEEVEVGAVTYNVGHADEEHEFRRTTTRHEAVKEQKLTRLSRIPTLSVQAMKSEALELRRELQRIQFAGRRIL